VPSVPLSDCTIVVWCVANGTVNFKHTHITPHASHPHNCSHSPHFYFVTVTRSTQRMNQAGILGHPSLAQVLCIQPPCTIDLFCSISVSLRVQLTQCIPPFLFSKTWKGICSIRNIVYFTRVRRVWEFRTRQRAYLVCLCKRTCRLGGLGSTEANVTIAFPHSRRTACPVVPKI
jgi:hypothetical protein